MVAGSTLLVMPSKHHDEGPFPAAALLLTMLRCSGIRDDGGRIMDRLLGMVRDVVLLD
jgi:hypothetical protein